MVEELLKGFVREEWVEKLDFATLEKVNGSYVTDDLQGRADDIVWRIKWGTDWLYVYILIEFQSTVDPWMAVRIMTYVGLLYQDLIRTNQLSAGRMLPPVLPVVLYNGDSKWTAATDISRLVQEIPGGLARYRPCLQYILLAERDYSDDELREEDNLVAALFRLENSRSPEQLLAVVINLLHWLSGPSQDSLRRAFTVWFSRVLFPTRFDTENQPVIEELHEVKTMLAERVKEWNKESMERGLQKGLQKGALQLLTRLLEKKFGSLPPDLMLRLTQSDEEQILQWSERILTADTLGDIFGN
ncbi:MAG: transposase [Proteobacteria bacterium]|nr:transposase [Pseudomonadota bacterium]